MFSYYCFVVLVSLVLSIVSFDQAQYAREKLPWDFVPAPHALLYFVWIVSHLKKYREPYVTTSCLLSWPLPLFIGMLFYRVFQRTTPLYY